MSERSAAFPWQGERPPHLPVARGDLPADILLPGDPDRVDRAAGVLDEAVAFGRRREFAAARGAWHGHPIGVCSSGIGGPSTEIAMVELANLGARRVIRIGGMGATDAGLALGTFVIVTAAGGGTGAARVYGDGEPASATPVIVEALEQAARQLGLPHARGVIRTTDSYYRGQARPTRAGDVAALALADLAAGFAGMDMESETVFTLGHALGLEVGAVLAVHANRATDRWLDDYEQTQTDLIRLAATAVSLLSSQGV